MKCAFYAVCVNVPASEPSLARLVMENEQMCTFEDYSDGFGWESQDTS
jgi:hypothetical protein